MQEKLTGDPQLYYLRAILLVRIGYLPRPLAFLVASTKT